MTEPDPRRVRDIFLDALEVSDDERDAFVTQACDGDADLESAVRALIDAEERSRGFLAREEEDEHGLVGRLLAALDEKSAKHREPPPDLSGVLVGDRYHVHETIGHGGFGVVYRARDQFRDRDVAVKFIPRAMRFGADSTRREISALLILDVPGVVRLIDDGEFEGFAYVVTELVHGSPFPGRPTPAPWSEVQPILDNLLESIVRVHWAGVIHGDLKPENVLVDEDGRVTLLDLGISSGPSVEIGAELGRTSAGTLPYLAPEQLDVSRAPPTERTDLFSVGVLLFEALTGSVPHHRTQLKDLLRARVAEGPDFASLADVELPGKVRRLLSQLLAHSPDDRPGSAAEALAALRGERPPEDVFRGREFPWLTRYSDQLVSLARSGVSAELGGDPGSGRSWILARVRSTLEAQRIRTWTVPPASGAGRSLASAFGDTGAAEPDLERQLHDALRRGEVVIADEWERIDARTRQILSDAREFGAVLRCGGRVGPEAIVVLPATADDLRELFAGHDRLFHEREDAAQLLFDRTGGSVRRIVAELSSWVRMKLARVEGHRAVVDREALERIESLPAGDLTGSSSPHVVVPDPSCADVLRVLALAGAADAETVAFTLARPIASVERDLLSLDNVGALTRSGDGRYVAAVPPPSWDAWTVQRRRAVHSALAERSPPASAERTRHLVEAGRVEDVGECAAAAVRHLVDQGRTARARTLLDRALSAVRAAGPDPDLDIPLTACVLRLAQEEGTARALELALHEINRTEARGGDVAVLKALARNSLLIVRGDAVRALSNLRALGELARVEDELGRRSLFQYAARLIDPATLREVDDECQAWARLHADVEDVTASALSWAGWRAYREGRFAEAARNHIDGAQQRSAPSGAAECLLNGASASLDAFRFEDACRTATEVRDFARGIRHVLLEARAERIARAAEYRMEIDRTADVTLVDASERLAAPNVAAMMLLTEAAFAWRGRETEAAGSLALRSAAQFETIGGTAGALLARALAAACETSAPVPPEEDLQLLLRCRLPGIRLQALGLHAIRSRKLGRECSDSARDALDSLEQAQRGVRREVISANEAAIALRL